MNPFISIRGARQHNLQSIDLDIPTGSIIALCGPSGSGKSSLAFDTLFAESRRRFLDCLSSQMRKNFEQPEKPCADSISGLPPSLCLEQTPSAGGPKSLLGSTTEILDYLRVLYAAAGTPHDPKTGVELIRQTPDQIVSSLLGFPETTRITLLSPVSSLLLNDINAALGDFQRQGFLRIRWNNDIVDIDEIKENTPESPPESIALVIDRIILKKESSPARIADSIQTSLRINEEELQALVQQPGEHPPELICFHTRFRNPETGFILPPLTPKHFSFHSPSGACQACKGTGIAPEKTPSQICPACKGTRLNPLALSVTLQWNETEYNISELIALPLAEFLSIADNVFLPAHLLSACRVLISELKKRLYFLDNIGLGYLSLNRTTNSLSGGEIQRARLASQLGGGLAGVLYILDEPTIGLHPSDTNRLIESLRQLRDMGNTVLVVEHDEQVLCSADYIIDMGPGAGIYGGSILAQGTPEELRNDPHSLTGSWLSGAKKMPEFIPPPTPFRQYLTLREANAHNLKNVTLRIPLGTLTSISGPSGSGKSTIINDCLIPALKDPEHYQITGIENISRFVLIDQSPIGKTQKSTPATATGLLDILRPLYAKLPLSRQRGYNSSRFSTNVRGGRCERCMGMGVIEINMHFLSNVMVPCDACEGQRYNRETLEVTWRGKSIAQALALNVDDALEFFSPIPKAASILSRMKEMGLGYLTLDRSSNTLSGGEAQRVKIAAELAKIPAINTNAHPAPSPSLFILDEPTTGLHFEETALLLNALSTLRSAGHTILCIEHNLDILLASDHVIDMGPGAGKLGGNIVEEGSPRQIAASPDAPTGKWLALKLKDKQA